MNTSDQKLGALISQVELQKIADHRREIAWHKSHGPALLATIMSAVRDGNYRLPASVKGIAPFDALERMRSGRSKKLRCRPGSSEVLACTNRYRAAAMQGGQYEQGSELRALGSG